jgi:hypothetical protein
MDERDSILQRIEEIEQELKQLRIDLNTNYKKVERKTNDAKTPQEGDLVLILNPRRGQKCKGTVIRVGAETNYVTVDTSKGKVVRHIGNVRVISKEEK